MRLVLLGPPGAGKGTQAAVIADRFGIPHISTGDIFRANVTEGTPLGREARGYMDRGAYVPDEVVNRMVADRLAQPDAAQGFLLDGYPRTLQQVEALDAMLAADRKSLDLVLHFVVDEEELQRRVARRQELEERSDDDQATFLRRLQEYRDQTASLVPHYRDRGLLADIDAVGAVEDVTERVLRACKDAGERS